MTASVGLRTLSARFFLAFLFLTKRVVEISFEVLNHVLAVSTPHLLLVLLIRVAGKSIVVRTHVAGIAKLPVTCRASHSELSFVYGSFFWNLLTIFCFLCKIHIPSFRDPHVATGALDQARYFVYWKVFWSRQLIELFNSYDLFNLKILYDSLALMLWADHRLLLNQGILRDWSNAVSTKHVAAGF